MPKLFVDEPNKGEYRLVEELNKRMWASLTLGDFDRWVASKFEDEKFSLPVKRLLTIKVYNRAKLRDQMLPALRFVLGLSPNLNAKERLALESIVGQSKQIGTKLGAAQRLLRTM